MKLSEKIQYLRGWAPRQPDILLCSKILDVCDAAQKHLSGEEKEEQCESGCDDPVVAHDVEGVPLCQGCYDECVEDMKTIPTD